GNAIGIAAPLNAPPAPLYLAGDPLLSCSGESCAGGKDSFARKRRVTKSDDFHIGGLATPASPHGANAEDPPMKKILDEFREFALKGNVLDMAIGIIIGGAFGTIVQSLVKDVIMPPIGMLIGGVDFSDIRIPLRAAAEG